MKLKWANIAFVASVSERVNKALARMLATPEKQQRQLEDDLEAARSKLSNVASAIRQGIVTPTTKVLLETCERRVAECESALAAGTVSPQRIIALPSVVEDYRNDMRGTLSTDTARARVLLGKLVGTITLRPEGDRLFGEVRGNLPGLLDVEFAKSGAGRGI